jgi:hypothetical protein
MLKRSLFLIFLVIGLMLLPVGNDKKLHFLVFSGLGILTYLSLSAFENTTIKKNATVLAIVIAALFGIIDEIHQSFVPCRSCSIYDWFADVAGITCAVLFWKLKEQRNVKINRVIPIALMLIVLMCGSASAVEYYVNNSHPSASDANAGTESLPWKTFSGAIGQLSEYDTLYVMGGTNYSGENILSSSTIVDNVLIVGMNNPVFNNSAQVFTVGAHNNPGLAVNNVTIKNILIRNEATSGSGAISFSYNSGGSSYVKFDNCDVYASGIPAVMFRALSNTNNIYLINSTFNGTAAITTQDNWGGTNPHIVNNTLVSRTNTGIEYARSGGNGSIIQGNNISSASTGIHFLDISTGTDIYNFQIRDNIIFAGLVGEGSGIWIRRGHDFVVDNNTIAYATYTGIKPAGESVNGTYSNNRLLANGYDHNAYELAGTDMRWLGNAILGVNTSKGDAWHPFYSPGTYPNTRMLIENNYATESEGSFIGTGGHVNQSIYKNMTAYQHDAGQSIRVYGYYYAPNDYPVTSNNLVFDNITTTNNDPNVAGSVYAIWSPGSNYSVPYDDYSNYSTDNITFIDVFVNGSYAGDTWYINDGGDLVNTAKAEIHAINVNAFDSLWSIAYPDECEVVIYEDYYAKIKVVDNIGTPIQGVALTFEANSTNPETSATLKPHNIDYGDVYKAYTDELDVAYTNSNGLTDTRYENASNCVALTAGMQYYTTSEQYQAVEWNVTATYNGTSNSTIITPDMLRYSPDSADIQSDLVTIVLGVDTTEEKQTSAVSFVAVVFTGLSFVGLHFANRFRRR